MCKPHGDRRACMTRVNVPEVENGNLRYYIHIIYIIVHDYMAHEITKMIL